MKLKLLLVMVAASACAQSILLPISTHTESLTDMFWKNVHASPTNAPLLVMTDSNNVVAFSVTIYSTFKSTDWFATLPPSKPIATTSVSNVFARIVWKGKTNEVLLETNAGSTTNR